MDGAGAATLQKLQITITQITHLVKRVTSRRPKLKDTISSVQALIISRVTYITPYLGLKNAEIEKLNVLIRQTYKLNWHWVYQARHRLRN